MDPIYFSDIKEFDAQQLSANYIFKNPDPIEQQSLFLKNDMNPNLAILIDYGSCSTKAGWQNSNEPDIIFRSVVSKNKDLKSLAQNVAVGNQLKDFDQMKANFRSPYEKNIIQHFGILENLNDYVFTELNIQNQKVDHPLVITECLHNPAYCRLNIMEQFFECYGIPSITIGVDSLFNYYHHFGDNLMKQNKNNCLLISIGNSTIHIIPILQGQIQRSDVKRINVGAQNSFEILQKNLILKNPVLKNNLSMPLIKAIEQTFVETAIDFKQQLNYTKDGINSFSNEYYKNSVQYANNLSVNQSILIDPIVINFPQTVKVIIMIIKLGKFKLLILLTSQFLMQIFLKKLLNQEDIVFQEELTLEEKQRRYQVRKEQGERLKEAIIKKRDEKQKILHIELKELEMMNESYNDDRENIDAQMKLIGFQKLENLQKRIKDLKIKLKLIDKDELQNEKYNLIMIPNDRLNPEQLRMKKIQQFHKQASETRALKREYDNIQKQQIQEEKDKNPEIYIKNLYDKREKLINKVESKKKQKQELAIRNSRANQKRMQTLAQLGGDNSIKTKKGTDKEDTFGMNDEDWNLYRGLSINDISDDENDEIIIQEIEIELRELDDNFETAIKSQNYIPSYLQTFEKSIRLGVERYRGPEVFFQPTIVGVDQSGIIDNILLVLKKYSPEVQKSLLENILLCGGGSSIKNLDQRLHYDLSANFEVGTPIRINKVDEPEIGPWLGMKNFDFAISRAEYEEYGSSYFKSNAFSNHILS